MPPPPPTASGPAQHPQLALRPRTTRNQSVQDRQVREATTLYFFRRQPFDTTPRPALTQLALDRLAGRRSTSRSVRLRAIGWSCAIPRLRHVLPAPCLACAVPCLRRALPAPRQGPADGGRRFTDWRRQSAPHCFTRLNSLRQHGPPLARSILGAAPQRQRSPRFPAAEASPPAPLHVCTRKHIPST